MTEKTPRYNTRSRKRSFELMNRQENEHFQKEEKRQVSEGGGNPEGESSNNVSSGLECAICLQTCVHPARLPCGHIFCFLCLKGIAHGSAKCAMCRRPIPRGYLDSPDLLETPIPSSSTATTSDGQESYQWFYEGRHGGWWQYEERTSTEIEERHARGELTFNTIICGRLYTIDLVTNVQFKTDNALQMRKILRELPSRVQRRGIAGISN